MSGYRSSSLSVDFGSARVVGVIFPMPDIFCSLVTRNIAAAESQEKVAATVKYFSSTMETSELPQSEVTKIQKKFTTN